MAVIDIEPLLKPISEASPSGEWLKFDPLYDQIKEARKEDENTGDQGVWETKQKKADWPAVRRLCSDALKKQTKDLWIGVWLLEAWTALESYDGLKAGLDLLNRLCADFWDTVYPEIEDDDVEYRVSPIVWLGDKYVVKLKSMPLTSPRSGGAVLTILDRENALEFDKKVRKEPSIAQETDMSTQMTIEKFSQSERETSDEYYIDLKEKISIVIESTSALETELDSRCGNDAPSLRTFRKIMEDALSFVNNTLKRRGLSDDGENDEDEADADSPDVATINITNVATSGVLTGGGIVQSREAAYDQIRKATTYLKQIEPHSPAPYLIERALKWGNMSLPQLLAELVADENNRSAIFGLLGIAAEQSSGSYDSGD